MVCWLRSAGKAYRCKSSGRILTQELVVFQAHRAGMAWPLHSKGLPWKTVASVTILIPPAPSTTAPASSRRSSSIRQRDKRPGRLAQWHFDVDGNARADGDGPVQSSRKDFADRTRLPYSDAVSGGAGMYHSGPDSRYGRAQLDISTLRSSATTPISACFQGDFRGFGRASYRTRPGDASGCKHPRSAGSLGG
jgi:hypothetical protein